MYSGISRSYILRNLVNRSSVRFQHAAATLQEPTQINFINAFLQKNHTKIDWPTFKNDILSKFGNMTSKNIDGVLLKVLISAQKIDAAISLAEHLKKVNEDLPIGPCNGILGLYANIAKSRKLTKDEKKCILDIHDSLYRKYKILDYKTSECLISALCVIDEWEKALKVLEDVHLSSVPVHASYSQIIATLFRNKKKKKAFELIKKSLDHKRSLQYVAYEAWINYINRSYRDKKTILKYVDEIMEHISINCAVVDEPTADLLKETYRDLGWSGEATKIRKRDGQCMKCNETLKQLSLTEAEFTQLQQNVKEKLIVGSDLFLKSSPEELKLFLDFVSKTAPYDIVIDALNVAYAVGKGSSDDKLSLLIAVVQFFKEQNKKILLLGRKHMLRWNKNSLNQLKRDTVSFFTEDLSQDDPYFITAAILSGCHTDIVSKDLLRTHTFQMKDENLRFLFRKWQWQHQWMVYTKYRGFNVQQPLSFTPSAQKSVGWHIPYQSSNTAHVEVNDGTPDLSHWLCLKPKLIQLDKLIA